MKGQRRTEERTEEKAKEENGDNKNKGTSRLRKSEKTKKAKK